MKTKKLVKKALKTPELYAPSEVLFFTNWLKQKKLNKTAKIHKDKGANS
jgi:hypothetical protein